jgi:hypothetical protein
MRIEKLPYKNIVKTIENKTLPHILDVELGNADHLKKFNSLECHIVLYPYCRNICSDDVIFNPYEEYVQDILCSHRSAYSKIANRFHQFFGLFMGAILFLLFTLFSPAGFFSIEAIIGILGAYFIGKDFWQDIEKLLIDLTRRWKIKYQDNYYTYQLEKHSTLTKYSYLAKKQRYKRETILPEKIDFIQQSNSQTIRMFFSKSIIKAIKNPSVHILSMHIDPAKIAQFNAEGHLFGVKLSYNKMFLCFRRSFEIFQSLSAGKKGCLDKRGEWYEGAVFFRKTLALGRIKLYLKSGVLKNISIIDTVKHNKN